jgi:hypothetical protein
MVSLLLISDRRFCFCRLSVDRISRMLRMMSVWLRVLAMFTASCPRVGAGKTTKPAFARKTVSVQTNALTLVGGVLARCGLAAMKSRIAALHSWLVVHRQVGAASKSNRIRLALVRAEMISSTATLAQVQCMDGKSASAPTCTKWSVVRLSDGCSSLALSSCILRVWAA